MNRTYGEHILPYYKIENKNEPSLWRTHFTLL